MSTSQPYSFYTQIKRAIDQNVTDMVKDNNLYDLINIQEQPIIQYEQQWNFLYFVRLMFYLLVFLKMVSLICFRRKKLDVRDRVYRKFLFSHSQLIRQFNQEDKQMMEIVLNNTIKNANLDKQLKLIKRISNKNKTVNFYQQKNEYFQPKKYDDDKQDKPISPELVSSLKNQSTNYNFDLIGVIQQKKQFLKQGQKQDINKKSEKISEQDFNIKNNLQKIQKIQPVEATQQSQWQKND